MCGVKWVERGGWYGTGGEGWRMLDEGVISSPTVYPFAVLYSGPLIVCLVGSEWICGVGLTRPREDTKP